MQQLADLAHLLHLRILRPINVINNNNNNNNNKRKERGQGSCLSPVQIFMPIAAYYTDSKCMMLHYTQAGCLGSAIARPLSHSYGAIARNYPYH